jgi:hypothetical protein
MKARIFLALIVGLFALPVLAADLNGAWTGQITDPSGNPHPLTLQLKVDGNKVTGTITGGPPSGEEQPLVNGKIEGDQLSFDVKTQGPAGEIVLAYKGKVAGNRIQGSNDSPMGSLPWEATKK